MLHFYVGHLYSSYLLMFALPNFKPCTLSPTPPYHTHLVMCILRRGWGTSCVTHGHGLTSSGIKAGPGPGVNVSDSERMTCYSTLYVGWHVISWQMSCNLTLWLGAWLWCQYQQQRATETLFHNSCCLACHILTYVMWFDTGARLAVSLLCQWKVCCGDQH